jgi:hypothetical protein
VRLSGVTSLRLEAARARIAYDGDAFFDGVSLAQRLNHEDETLSAALRYAVTPLTAFVVDTAVERLRFPLSPHRDADGVALVSGLEFDALAILSGHAVAGIRSLRGRSPILPDFRGFTGSVALTYPFRPATRFGISFERDLGYSYRDAEPYYVLTGWGGSLRQRFADAWELEARGALERHTYQPGLATSRRHAPDVIVDYSARLSRDIAASSQLTIDIGVRHRESPVAHRRYRGMRLHAAATHGF